MSELEKLEKKVADADAAYDASFYVYDEAYSTKKEARRLLRNYLKEQANAT